MFWLASRLLIFQPGRRPKEYDRKSFRQPNGIPVGGQFASHHPRRGDLFFALPGKDVLFAADGSLGYVSLPELEAYNHGDYMVIERDCYFSQSNLAHVTRDN